MQRRFKTNAKVIEAMNTEVKLGVFHAWKRAGEDVHHLYEFVLNPPEGMVERCGKYLVRLGPVTTEMADKIKARNKAARMKIAGRVNYLQRGKIAVRHAKDRTLLKANDIAPGLAVVCDSWAQSHLREEQDVDRILLSLPKKREIKD